MIKIFLRYIRRIFRKIIYKGDKFVCPYCHFHSSSFYKIGQPHQANIIHNIVGTGVRNGGCYSCDSVDRDRLLYAYFNDEIGLFRDNEDLLILHFAPELRLSELFLKYKFKKYVCIDKFMPGYKYPKHTINMDILDIKFDDNTFDWVICNHVLEHISDDIKAMNELYRVLKVGGNAILKVPISNTLEKTYENSDVITDDERIQHYGQFDHVRIYAKDYVTRLESVGFKVRRMNISDKYSHYGVINEEDLFICTK